MWSRAVYSTFCSLPLAIHKRITLGGCCFVEMIHCNRLCKYFRGNQHLEEIMLKENIQRSELLTLIDKFSEILVTCTLPEHSKMHKWRLLSIIVLVLLFSFLSVLVLVLGVVSTAGSRQNPQQDGHHRNHNSSHYTNQHQDTCSEEWLAGQIMLSPGSIVVDLTCENTDKTTEVRSNAPCRNTNL